MNGSDKETRYHNVHCYECQGTARHNFWTGDYWCPDCGAEGTIHVLSNAA